MYVLNAQSDLPGFKRNPTVPPIQLTQTDGTLLTKDKLKKNTPVVIMFFSPDCDHCQHQTAEMVLRIKELEPYQIIMATYQPMEDLITFRKNYQLDKYPNIKTGRDAKFLLPSFYNIKSLPFLALYNKKGDLLKSYEGNVKVDEMIKELKK